MGTLIKAASLNSWCFLVRLGIVPKLSSQEAVELALKIIKYAESLGVKTFLDERIKRRGGWPTFSLGRENVDVVIVVGGDGTVLSTLHALKDSDTPIATIRYGKRGFLCDVPPFEYKAVIDRLLEGNYVLHRYMRLSALLEDKELPPALNDYAVVTNGPSRSKVGRLQVSRDEEIVFSVVGDGLIIAPPIGSTAYALAAGGPVVDPLMEAIILAPLAPATLCSRPVVLPPSSRVRVTVRSDSPPLELIVDGQVTVRLRPGDEVLVRKADKPAKFLRFFTGDHYVKLFSRCM